MKSSDTRMAKRLKAKTYATKYFSFPEHIKQQYFSNYYLLYWNNSYFLKKTIEGKILVPDLDTGTEVEYIILYYSTNRSRIAADPSEQVALSFRAPKPEFGLPNYVLVGAA